MKHKLILLDLRHFRLVIQILYGHADFEVVAVFGKDRVYQFRKYIVAGYRSNHTVFDIVRSVLNGCPPDIQHPITSLFNLDIHQL